RYSLLVEPEHEAAAIRIVRALPGGQRNRARVIQGDKARRDAERLSLPAESIIEVMRFSHRTAEWFLRASYGAVQRVADAEALRGSARGVTPDGMGSGSYSMFRCDLDDSELLFGQAARERALQAKLRECEQLGIEAHQAEQEHRHLQRLCERVDEIRAVDCAARIRAMLELHQRSAQTEAALARLDLSGFEALEQQLVENAARHRTLEDQERALQKEAGALEEKAGQSEAAVRKLADSQDNLQEIQQACEEAVQRSAELYPDRDAEQALDQAEARARQAGRDFDFRDEAASLTASLEQAERQLYQAVMKHNQHCRPHEAIVYEGGAAERHDEAFFRR